MTEADLPALLEERASRAWPAETDEPVSGWRVRCTPGTSGRRLNSLLPPADPATAAATLEAALAAAATMYAAHGRPVVVQVTPAHVHVGLDAVLGRRGLVLEAPTRVLQGSAADVAGRSAARGPATCVLATTAADVWLDARAVAAGSADRGAYAGVLDRVSLPTALLVATAGGQPAGVALSVAEEGEAGIFGMVTAPEWRRRGVGRSLLAAAAEWALSTGARRLYLQVEEDNGPARHLYAAVGLAESHRYHYRRAQDPL